MIGVFDSGHGGLTVLRRLAARLPEEYFVYLGDHAYAPYGRREPEEIYRLTLQSVGWLFQYGCRLVLRYIVREASVTETALETETGVTGLLTTDQAERYEARIVVDLQILDGRRVEATANAEARRFITVPEGISLKERERVWYDLTKNTMQDLNKQLEETIRSAFFPYVVL